MDEMTFTAETESFGRMMTSELKPGGAKIMVTDENKAEYVKLVCENRLVHAISSQIGAFVGGLHEMIKVETLSLFSAAELELLISGMPEIDIVDLKNNTEFTGGLKASSPVVGWFWNVVESLTRDEKAKLVMFFSGSTKVPLEGFAALQGMRGASPPLEPFSAFYPLTPPSPPQASRSSPSTRRSTPPRCRPRTRASIRSTSLNTRVRPF